MFSGVWTGTCEVEKVGMACSEPRCVQYWMDALCGLERLGWRQQWSSGYHGQEISPGNSSTRDVHHITNMGFELEELGLELSTGEARACLYEGLR